MGNYLNCAAGSWNPMCMLFSSSRAMMGDSSYKVTGSDGNSYMVKVWPSVHNIDTEDLCFLDSDQVPEDASPSLRKMLDLQDLDKLFEGRFVDEAALTELAAEIDPQELAEDYALLNLTPAFCVGKTDVTNILFGAK